MQNNFKNLSERLFKSLNKEEILTLSLSGEKSHFCRLNQSKVRQIGNVVDTRLSLSIIYDNRICHGGITLSNHFDTDIERAITELNRLKEEVKQLPVDPFLVMPLNTDSLVEVNQGSLLSFKIHFSLHISLIPNIRIKTKTSSATTTLNSSWIIYY